MTTCECGLLHPGPSRGRSCSECGITCCPSCAIRVDDGAYCRWCAIALQPTVGT